QQEEERVYRKIPYGPLLDVFVIDMRSYRGPNTYNRQTEINAESQYLGATQLAWLRDALKRSRATWKVIASDMPIGLQVTDGPDDRAPARSAGAITVEHDAAAAARLTGTAAASQSQRQIRCSQTGTR